MHWILIIPEDLLGAKKAVSTTTSSVQIDPLADIKIFWISEGGEPVKHRARRDPHAVAIIGRIGPAR